jgi:MBOAT, membrane-bound O-acyltransferase family
VLDTEFPENIRMSSEAWNMKTSIWLRECIYKRVTKKGAKPGFASSMMTYVVSAIWVISSSFSVPLSLLTKIRCSTELRLVIIWRSYSSVS